VNNAYDVKEFDAEKDVSGCGFAVLSGQTYSKRQNNTDKVRTT
jgi:hypothetical protein